MSSINSSTTVTACDCSLCRCGLDCKYVDVEPYPFYPMAQPFIYFARTHSGKSQEGRKSNFFVRAFKWYTDEHHPPSTSKDDPFNDKCYDSCSQTKNVNITDFAKWLDTKYEQYLAQQNDVCCTETTTLLEGTNVLVMDHNGNESSCNKKSKKMKCSRSKQRKSRSLERDCPKDCKSEYETMVKRSSLHYLMPPKTVSRVASECCQPIVNNPRSTSKVICKSQSVTTVCMQESGTAQPKVENPPSEQKEPPKTNMQSNDKSLKEKNQSKGTSKTSKLSLKEKKQSKRNVKNVTCQCYVPLAANYAQTPLSKTPKSDKSTQKDSSSDHKVPTVETKVKDTGLNTPRKPCNNTDGSTQCYSELKLEAQSQYQKPEEQSPCPTFGAPCPSSTKKTDLEPCPSLKIPCPAERPCPTLREPCPSKRDSEVQSAPIKVQLSNLQPCPTYNEPCPSKQGSKTYPKVPCPSLEIPCPAIRPCPTLREPCPSKGDPSVHGIEPQSYSCSNKDKPEEKLNIPLRASFEAPTTSIPWKLQPCEPGVCTQEKCHAEVEIQTIDMLETKDVLPCPAYNKICPSANDPLSKSFKPCPSLQEPCYARRTCPSLRQPCQKLTSTKPVECLSRQTNLQKPEVCHQESCIACELKNQPMKDALNQVRPKGHEPCGVRIESVTKITGQDVALSETRKIEMQETPTEHGHRKCLRCQRRDLQRSEEVQQEKQLNYNDPLPTCVVRQQSFRTSTNCQENPRRSPNLQGICPNRSHCQPLTHLSKASSNIPETTKRGEQFFVGEQLSLLQQQGEERSVTNIQHTIYSQTVLREQASTLHQTDVKTMKNTCDFNQQTSPCIRQPSPSLTCRCPKCHENCVIHEQPNCVVQNNTNAQQMPSQQNITKPPLAVSYLPARPVIIGHCSVNCPFIAKMITAKPEVREAASTTLCTAVVQTSDHSIKLDKEISAVPFFMKIVCADKLK